MPWASCQTQSHGSVGRKLGRGNSLLSCMHHAVEVCICVRLASGDYRYETSYGIDAGMWKTRGKKGKKYREIQVISSLFFFVMVIINLSLFVATKVQLPCRVLEGTIISLAATPGQIITHFLGPRLPREILILRRPGLCSPPFMLQDL